MKKLSIGLSILLSLITSGQNEQTEIVAESVQQETEYVNTDTVMSEKEFAKFLNDVWESDPKRGKNPDYATELFVVESETGDGYLNAISLDEDTNAPNGYILDDKYEVGDIVEVTYSHDDILEEKKVTGIFAQTEDGEYVPVSFY